MMTDFNSLRADSAVILIALPFNTRYQCFDKLHRKRCLTVFAVHIMNMFWLESVRRTICGVNICSIFYVFNDTCRFIFGDLNRCVNMISNVISHRKVNKKVQDIILQYYLNWSDNRLIVHKCFHNNYFLVLFLLQLDLLSTWHLSRASWYQNKFQESFKTNNVCSWVTCCQCSDCRQV